MPNLIRAHHRFLVMNKSNGKSINNGYRKIKQAKDKLRKLGKGYIIMEQKGVYHSTGEPSFTFENHAQNNKVD